MPEAARVKDHHICPVHGGGPILDGCPTVFIHGKLAARVGDTATCGDSIDKIAKGSKTVFIGKKFAARVGDETLHGGAVDEGDGTVFIGG
jgi:uncharacterized Zn-binding protein involved in type VI secretion